MSFNYRLFTKEKGNHQEIYLVPSEVHHQRSSGNSDLNNWNEELGRATILSDNPATSHAYKAKRNIEHGPEVQFNRSELMNSGLRNASHGLPFSSHNEIFSMPNMTERSQLIPRQMFYTPMHSDISDYYKVVERPSNVQMGEGLNKYHCFPNQKQLAINSRVVSERQGEIEADEITSSKSRRLHDNPGDDPRAVAGSFRSRYEELICPVCAKEFSSKSKLERHSVMHSREKPFICDVCQKCYTQKCHLKNHMLSHTGLKPHKCGECGKAFTSKHHLEAHMRTHSGDKPFTCDICGKTFTQKGNQKRHILNHKRGKTA